MNKKRPDEQEAFQYINNVIDTLQEIEDARKQAEEALQHAHELRRKMMSKPASLQGKPEEKPIEKKEDKGLFLQLPFILIDTFDMSDSAMVGFIRFCREYLQKDKTINYHGSYRLLAKDIKQARMTCYRSVEGWVKAGLIEKRETPDEFVLTGNLSSLWEKNPAHCKSHQRPKFKSLASQIETDTFSTMSQNNQNSVPNLNAAIPSRDENGKKWDANERKIDPIDTIDTLPDTRERSANAPRTLTLLSLELDCDAEDFPEAQPPIKHINPSASYSQDTPQQPIQSKQTEKTYSSDVPGYKQTTDVNAPNENETHSQPEKPARQKRERKPKTEKVEQPTLLDTSKKAVAYNEAEQRVFDWYCGCDFIHVKPEQDANKKKHCSTLAPHVHSQEEMQDLANFTRRWLKEHFKQDVHIVKMGNMAYSDTLNDWIAICQKTKEQPPTPEQKQPIEFDPDKLVRWTRYQHPGTAVDHWYLYELMPVSEALKFGWKKDAISPNDKLDIRTRLKMLAEGEIRLTPEQQIEKDTAELRLPVAA